MLRAFILTRVAKAERDLGVPLEYLRHIVKVSLRAFFKFTKFLPLAEYRRTLPPEPYHIARLVAVRHEDCGTCVQIEVNNARRDNVSADLIRAVLQRRLDDLPEPLREVYRFTETVVQLTDDEPLRERIRQRYGEEAFVELALGIAACRVFPTTKRALGYAKSCAMVQVYV